MDFARHFASAPYLHISNHICAIIRKKLAMADEAILSFVADIVSAHVSNNGVSAAELPGLIEAVYTALDALGAPMPVVEEIRQPAVSIRSSVKPDAITCLECGAKQMMLKRHLRTDHGLTPAEYKARWNLGSDYPLVAPEYAARRRDLALKIGLGRKPGAKVKPSKAKATAKAGRKPRVAKTPTGVAGG